MSDFAWIAEQDRLTPAALTVRAQTIDPTDTGRLLWDSFFPRRDVDSVKLNEMTTIDFRPAADRREWNQRGRFIPLETPPTREFEMVPVESYFSIAEYELQRLAERTVGNQGRWQEEVANQIPPRTDGLVESLYRRLEVEAMTAWAFGTITANNPQTGTTQVLDYGYDTNRYTTAGTTWSSSNAYGFFITWLESAMEYIGDVGGAMMRLATFRDLQESAPNKFIPDSALGLRVTASQLRQLVSDDLGVPFTLYVNENSLDLFTDGGTAYTRTKVWPADMVAAVPAGSEAIGSTAFAPVRRAVELARQVPGAGIDMRGATVYHHEANGGRELTVEAQFNAMPVPNEQKVFVIDTTA
jgi:hypothetical protein